MVFTISLRILCEIPSKLVLHIWFWKMITFRANSYRLYVQHIYLHLFISLRTLAFIYKISYGIHWHELFCHIVCVCVCVYMPSVPIWRTTNLSSFKLSQIASSFIIRTTASERRDPERKINLLFSLCSRFFYGIDERRASCSIWSWCEYANYFCLCLSWVKFERRGAHTNLCGLNLDRFVFAHFDATNNDS